MTEEEARAQADAILGRFERTLEAAFDRSIDIVPGGSNRLLRYARDAAHFAVAARTGAAAVDRLHEAIAVFESYAAADDATLRRAIPQRTVDIRPHAARGDRI
jgi:hypothetical protein